MATIIDTNAAPYVNAAREGGWAVAHDAFPALGYAVVHGVRRGVWFRLVVGANPEDVTITTRYTAPGAGAFTVADPCVGAFLDGGRIPADGYVPAAPMPLSKLPAALAGR